VDSKTLNAIFSEAGQKSPLELALAELEQENEQIGVSAALKVRSFCQLQVGFDLAGARSEANGRGREASRENLFIR